MLKALCILPLLQLSLVRVDLPLIEPDVLTEDVAHCRVLLEAFLLLDTQQSLALVVCLDYLLDELVKRG